MLLFIADICYNLIDEINDLYLLLACHLLLFTAHFGTGVVSYFVFLKWLFQLDLIIFFLIVIFIVIPQAVLGTGNSTYNEPCTNSKYLNYLNIVFDDAVADPVGSCD